MNAKDITMAYLEYSETDNEKKLYDAFMAGANYAEKQLKKELAEKLITLMDEDAKKGVECCTKSLSYQMIQQLVNENQHENGKK